MAYCGGGVGDESQMDDDGVDMPFAVEFNFPIHSMCKRRTGGFNCKTVQLM